MDLLQLNNIEGVNGFQDASHSLQVREIDVLYVEDFLGTLHSFRVYSQHKMYLKMKPASRAALPSSTQIIHYLSPQFFQCKFLRDYAVKLTTEKIQVEMNQHIDVQSFECWSPEIAGECVSPYWSIYSWTIAESHLQ